MMKVTIYTDGAARGNPDGPGGYGTVIEYVDLKGKRTCQGIIPGHMKRLPTTGWN